MSFMCTWTAKALFVAILAATSVACSGGDDGDDGDDGKQSDGDEPGNVGLRVVIGNPDPNVPEAAGKACPTSSGVQWDVGDPPPTTNSPGTPVPGASCFVSSDGAFHVSARATDETIASPNGIIQIEFAGTAQSLGEMGLTAIYTPLTGDLRSGLQPCLIAAVKAVNAGELWMDFDCPLLGYENSPSLGCRATGTVALAGCGH
jgi:hypothetical protein